MKFLASKNVSGACAIINGVLVFNFAITGNWLLALMSAGFCGLCATTYFKASD